MAKQVAPEPLMRASRAPGSARIVVRTFAMGGASAIAGASRSLFKAESAAAMAAALSALNNDLEAPAIALAPPIAKVLTTMRALPGALLARMSGSGATCFAIFATPAEAASAAASLHQPGWWCWGGGLYEPGPARL